MVEPKTYDCPYTGGKVSGIGARNCNYSSLDDYSCRHSGCDCVAKEGMIEFEQTEPYLLAGYHKSLESEQGLAKCISLDSEDEFEAFLDSVLPPKIPLSAKRIKKDLEN